MTMILFWSLLAAISAAANEVFMRMHGGFHWSMLLIEAPLVYALAQVMAKTDSFVSGLVIFSAAILVIRTIAALTLFKEETNTANIAALVLLVAASGVKFVWK